MYPIFFSGSSKDQSYIEEVWAKLPDEWAYFYTMTGEEGVHMWSEIKEDILRKCRLIVIFWSQNFPNSEGCIEEILRAKELVSTGKLRPLVIRLDDYPILWDDRMCSKQKPVYEALLTMLDVRTSEINCGIPEAIRLVERVAEPMLKAQHPMLPRPELHATLEKAVVARRFEKLPTVWVSGFNGVGRQSFITEFVRRYNPNGKCYIVEIDESSLPIQILSRIESRALGASSARLLEIAGLSDAQALAGIAAAIESISQARNFIVLRHSRIVEENVDLPEWLNEVIANLESSTKPKLFVISQLPLLQDRREKCSGKIAAQRVPTVDQHLMVDFCPELIGHFDPNPQRWSDSEIQRLVDAAGGTLGFLVSLVSAASTMEDFDDIDALVSQDAENRAASLTAYVRWAFAQLRSFDDELKALAFLNDVSPVDILDLEQAIGTERPILRILGKLLNLGLVEREDEGVYRITPLLSRRMSRDLLRPDLLRWLRERLENYLETPIKADVGSDEYIRIESRIQASMLAGGDQIPENLRQFVSASHWFHAGIRLYHARRREPAYRILKRAYELRSEFRLQSRVEVTRYFGLASTRNRKYHETEECIRQLNQMQSTKSMAAFLEADMYEHQRDFVKAISHYQKSIDLDGGRNSRLERTYRPLIRCILFSPRPDYVLAERYAKKWLIIRETGFSLTALARVYLHWLYRGNHHSRSTPADLRKRYEDAFEDLSSYPGIGSSPFEIKAEEAEFEGNFSLALDYMDRAIEADPRFELRSERWRLMAKSGDKTTVRQVISELEDAKHDPAYEANWVPFLPNLALTYAIALKSLGHSTGLINTFASELESSEIAAIIRKVPTRR